MSECHNHTHCIETVFAQAEDICEKRNIRLTPIRKYVLGLIWHSHHGVKAYDLLDKIKDFDASSKPPTIYRSLDFLLENGLIHKIHSHNLYVGCMHPLSHRDCIFLICHQCFSVTEACNTHIHALLGDITTQHHFKAVHQMIEISGLCRTCNQTLHS